MFVLKGGLLGVVEQLVGAVIAKVCQHYGSTSCHMDDKVSLNAGHRRRVGMGLLEVWLLHLC